MVVERRRSPRAAVKSGSWLTGPSTWPVQLVDLSLRGLSFTSPYGLEVGRIASLRTTLGPEAFNGQVRVRWSRPVKASAAVAPRFEVGAVFLSLEESSRSALQAFLKLSPSE